jgi:hypothetical protein
MILTTAPSPRQVGWRAGRSVSSGGPPSSSSSLEEEEEEESQFGSHVRLRPSFFKIVLAPLKLMTNTGVTWGVIPADATPLGRGVAHRARSELGVSCSSQTLTGVLPGWPTSMLRECLRAVGIGIPPAASASSATAREPEAALRSPAPASPSSPSPWSSSSSSSSLAHQRSASPPPGRVTCAHSTA